MEYDVLITGGTGFIGQKLIKKLLADGYSLCSLQRSSNKIKGVHNTIIIDDFNEENIKNAVSSIRCNQIIHMAAYGHHPYDVDPKLSEYINVKLVCDVLHNIDHNHLSSVIGIGSCAEYQKPDDESACDEDSKLETEKVYGSTKAQGGLRVRKICRDIGLGYSYLRLFHTYGYGEEEYRLIPYLVNSLLNKQNAELSSGIQIRDFIYIDDVTAAIMRVKQLLDSRDIYDEIFNVGSGNPVSIRDVAETVARVCGCKQDLLSFGNIALRPDEIPFLVADISKITNMTGWRPRIELENGIRKYVQIMTKER